MLILKMARATFADQDPAAFEARLESAPSDFKPLIRAVRELQTRILGVRIAAGSGAAVPLRGSGAYASEAQSSILLAELFTDGRALYLISVERGDPRLAANLAEAGPFLCLRYIGPDLDSSGLAKFEHFASEAFGVNLVPHPLVSRRFEDMRRAGRDAPPAASHEELRAAMVLCDRTARTLAAAIQASGGLLVKDLVRQVGGDAREKLEEMQAALLGAGLIESEIVVVCQKTQAQIARAPSREALHGLTGSGLKCACGRPLSDEGVEESLAITTAGHAQLDKSRWLATLVLAELEGVGVSRDRTRVEMHDDGDELNLLAEISGELVLFELKDREFSLRQAYSLGAKLGLLEPQHAVVVTTASVDSSAKEHFQRARSAARSVGSLRCIEGVDDLSGGIAALASEIYTGHAARLLAQVLPLGLLDPSAILAGFDEASEERAAPDRQITAEAVGWEAEAPPQRSKRGAR